MYKSCSQFQISQIGKFSVGSINTQVQRTLEIIKFPCLETRENCYEIEGI